MLPLAGSPRLAVLGREVRLGTGSADLLAVESTGRLVIIEVKLAENAESRRAVVAQVLSYAGYLQGLDPEQLESRILGRHL
jgi:RecB family endonuclease NucS